MYAETRKCACYKQTRIRKPENRVQRKRVENDMSPNYSNAAQKATNETQRNHQTEPATNIRAPAANASLSAQETYVLKKKKNCRAAPTTDRRKHTPVNKQPPAENALRPIQLSLYLSKHGKPAKPAKPPAMLKCPRKRSRLNRTATGGTVFSIRKPNMEEQNM